MTTVTHRHPDLEIAGALRLGTALMAVAGLAFVGYAVIFFVRNFTGAFLELGIGPGLGVALPAHYPWGFDTIGHLGLIYLATAIFVVGAALALKPLLAEHGSQGA